jgi:hypothetical protein
MTTMGRREAEAIDDEPLLDDVSPVDDEEPEADEADRDEHDDQDGDDSSGIDDIPDDDSDEDDELPRAIRICGRCGQRGYHTGRCAKCVMASRIHDEMQARATTQTTKAVEAMVTKRVVIEQATKPAAKQPIPAKSRTKPPTMKKASAATKPQRVNSPAPVGPAAPDTTVVSGPICAKCNVNPVGRVLAGCKNNDCCPDCRRKARQSAAAKREQRAKKLSHKTAVRKTAPKPVTAPAATPTEMASRMVEAFAIVDAIGWETCRALRARIEGGAK